MATAHEKLSLELKLSLEATGVCQVLIVQSRKGDVRMLFRVTDEPKWLRLLALFLANEDREAWYTFFGKRYFLDNGKLKMAWMMVVDTQGKVDITSVVKAVRQCLELASTRLSRGEVSAEPVEPEIRRARAPAFFTAKQIGNIRATSARTGDE